MREGDLSYKVVVLDGPTGPGNVEENELASVGATVVRSRTGSADEALALVADAAAILCDASSITAALLDGAPRLRIVSEYGIGVDNIDVAAATERGIWVANVPGFCADEVATHTMGLILAANRHLLRLDRSVRAGGWDAIAGLSGAERLSEQTLGIVGFGQIGRRVARLAAAFGLHVLAFSPRTTPEIAREYGAQRVDLGELFAQSDYVSLHLPSTPDTRNLIDAAALARFKPNAWLINTARGNIVDEAALIDALQDQRLAGAALDVRRVEPPPPDDPLRNLPNVILTPHAAYYSERSILELRQRAARNVAAVLAGGRPVDPVNPEM
ncbi:MAG TPA: C-terminal binding protein [Chloroflexota bacterium]|nr:C-terminal binding protein [Chloroflexota bacterium]